MLHECVTMLMSNGCYIGMLQQQQWFFYSVMAYVYQYIVCFLNSLSSLYILFECKHQVTKPLGCCSSDLLMMTDADWVKNPKGLYVGQAMYSFSARGPDELSISPGQMVFLAPNGIFLIAYCSGYVCFVWMTG